MLPYSLFKLKSYSRRASILCVLIFITLLIIFPGTSNADLTEMTKLVAGDGAYDDFFGSSVATSGDNVIVGAPKDDEGGLTNSGAAYIFQRSGSTWIQIAKLMAPDRSHNDAFGYSVSISGDYAIVGKPFDDHTGIDYGSAYIFYRNQDGPNQWGQMAKLVASDGGASDYFGNSVAISGNYAIVGAPFDDDNGADSGSAYIFQLKDNSWQQMAKLIPPEELAAGDYFGYSVAINGDNAVVGAPRDDNERGSNAGSIFVFRRTDSTWSGWRLIDPNGSADDEFGWSVSIDGSFAVSGAHYHDGGEGLANSGSARIFEEFYDTGLWGTLEYQKLTPSDIEASDEFGFSVSITGDCSLVGTLKYTHGTGVVYVFRKSTEDHDWPQIERLIASDGSIWGFGSAVSVSGNYAVVGAKWDVNSAGSAYVYNLSEEPSPPPSRGAMPGIPLLLLDD